MFERTTFGDSGAESWDGNISGRQVVDALDGATICRDRRTAHSRGLVIMTDSPAGEYTLVRAR
jgi:hypothetical protein